MNIEKLTVGQILYDVTGKKWTMPDGRRIHEYFRVRVVDIDLVHRRVLLSHNNNTPRWRNETNIKHLQLSPPKTKFKEEAQKTNE